MTNVVLDGHTIKRLIQRAGRGHGFVERAQDIAQQCHTSQRTLYNYMEKGARKGAINANLVALAVQHGIISTSPSEGVENA